MPKPRPRNALSARYWNHERRVFLGAIAVALPGLIGFAITLAWLRPERSIVITAGIAVVIATLALALHLRG